MMTVRHLLIAGIFIASSTLLAQGVDRETYLREYAQRVDYVVHAYDTSTAKGYNQVAVRYARNSKVKEADAMFEELLQEPRGDMFWMFPCIGAYLHGKDKMSPRTAAAVRNAWKTYAPYRGDTENHWVMYYASLFLAAEQWPNLPGSEWYNGRSSDENRQEAREYLIEWMRITTTIGQGEFDSPEYFPEYAIPMSLLSQFAQDKEMRLRGTMMLDYILADFAVEHLEGMYVGGFSRVFQPAAYRPLVSGASAFAYLYFGTGTPSTSGWIVLPSLGSYRLPEIIYRVALDRRESYIHKERKRVRNVIRYGTELNPPVYKYTYVTKDYALGSLQGGILQPIQQQTWNVRYTHGRPYTAIFGLHPYWSGFELAMFFPEEPKTLIADVVASKGTYNNPNKWTGGSPFERTFQHKNTIMVLYDIEPGTTTEHIDGFFPKNLDVREVDASGWIICKAGDTYVGWYPLQEYEWIEEFENLPPSSASTVKESGNWRLRSHKLQNGYVVEVRSKEEIGSFERFRALLRKRTPKAQLAPGRVSVDYTTIDGARMEFSYPDTRKLNNRIVDLSKTKLFDGPYLNAEVGSERLTITHRKTKRILDFKKLTITE